MQNNNEDENSVCPSDDKLIPDNLTQRVSKNSTASISVTAAGEASTKITTKSIETKVVLNNDTTMQKTTNSEGNTIPPAKSTSNAPIPAPRRGAGANKTGSTINGNTSTQCILTHQRSIESNGDSISLAADTMSVASKTSRSSRFLRGVSFRRSRAATWLAAKLRKHQKSSDLSAAFNLLDQENKGVLVDLNSATEEELMTVQGITRAVARSIVEYRGAIGGFRSLQDLALVSGVGAARLTALCRDLTIQCSDDQSRQSPPSLSSRPPSIASAPTPSPHSNKLLPPPHPPTSSQPSLQYSSSPHSSHPTSHLSTPVHPPLPACASTPSTPSPALNAFPLRHVNLNTASIFELMTVPGVNQEMAANIVHYRDRKGPFRTVDEVTRVRGMRAKQTRHLHPHLTVTENGGSSSTPRHSTSNSTLAIGGERGNASLEANDCPSQSSSQQDSMQPPAVASRALYRSRHRRTLSAPSQNNGISSKLGTPNLRVELPEENDEELFQSALSNGGEIGSHQKSLDSPVKSSHRLSIEFSSDVYELLSLRSERPEINGLFENRHNGRSAIRLATWNLSQLTPDKISNPGVMEVVCRTVLERGISVLAVQDLLAANLLEKICTELNSGSLRRVREWPGKKGSWSFIQSREPVANYTLCSRTRIACNEYVGFLFNKRYVELVEDSVLDCGVKHHRYTSKPHMARFKTGHLTFVAANLHVKHHSLIFRSESFLQSFGELPSNSSCNPGDQSSSADGLPCEGLETEVEPASLDALKSNKNLQNGLIKENNILNLDELCRTGGSAGSSSSSSAGAKRKLDLNGTHLTNGTADSSLEDELKTVLAKVQQENDQENLVILGDIGVSPDSEGVSNLVEAGYSSVLEEDVSTVLSGSGVTPSPPQSCDNIWLGPPLLPSYTGSCCCVKDGLSHLAIPRGWGWGGLATPHCPVYADLYTDMAR